MNGWMDACHKTAKTEKESGMFEKREGCKEMCTRLIKNQGRKEGERKERRGVFIFKYVSVLASTISWTFSLDGLK